MPSVVYGTKIIEFEVLRKAKLKNTYIQVTSDGVRVKTNMSTSMREIKNFVSKKSAWIVKHSEKQVSKSVEQKLVTGSRIYYLGKSYYVKLQENAELKYARVVFSHSQFVIEARKDVSQEELWWVIDLFYKQKAIEKITPLLDKWSKEMNLESAHVGFRKAKTRWGSCSSRNRISFNYYLMKLPLSLVEYVVVHELVHIKHHNHSKEFWKVVYDYVPNYKEREEKIKVFEKLI